MCQAVSYLVHTKGKGLIIKPSTNLNLELFADADFAGLWGHEDPTDPVSVRSRTGLVITLGGAPSSGRAGCRLKPPSLP